MNSQEQAEKMEKHLLKTRFPLECEEIPLDSLNADEQIVVIKCRDKQELTDDEFKLLKKVLAQYRPSILEYRPNETIEAIDATTEVIKTEKDWLDLIDSTEITLLNVNVPYRGKWYPMTFEVLAMDDSRVVSTLETHVNLFRDYSPEELSAFTKAQQGHKLTREEAAIAQKITKKLEEKTSSNRMETINNFLASQLKLQNSTEDFETRKQFWTKFPFMVKSAIMIKVEDMLGLSEYSNEKLFPDS